MTGCVGYCMEKNTRWACDLDGDEEAGMVSNGFELDRWQWNAAKAYSSLCLEVRYEDGSKGDATSFI